MLGNNVTLCAVERGPLAHLPGMRGEAEARAAFAKDMVADNKTAKKYLFFLLLQSVLNDRRIRSSAVGAMRGGNKSRLLWRARLLVALDSAELESTE